MNKRAVLFVGCNMIYPRHLLIPIALLALGHASAEEPTWKHELASTTPGGFTRLGHSVLDYQVSWKNIVNSGKLRLEFTPPPESAKTAPLVVSSAAKSTGIAAGLFPYCSDFRAELNPSDFQPRLFHAVESDLTYKTVTSTTRHFADRVEMKETTFSLRKGTGTERERVFKFAPVYDMFSAMLMIRSQRLEPGDQINLVLNPFGTPLLLRTKVLGREVHLGYNSIRLSVGISKIDRNTMQLSPYLKMKNDATIWLSDDESRVPLEFRAGIFIGDVRAILTRHQRKA